MEQPQQPWSWTVIKIVMMASSAGVWLKKISTKQTIKLEWLLTFSLAISSSLLCWNPLGSIFPSSTESLWATRRVTSKQTYLWWSQCCFRTSPQQRPWWGQCKELPLWRGHWHPKGMPGLWFTPLNCKLQRANNIQTKQINILESGVAKASSPREHGGCCIHVVKARGHHSGWVMGEQQHQARASETKRASW